MCTWGNFDKLLIVSYSNSLIPPLYNLPEINSKFCDLRNKFRSCLNFISSIFESDF